MNTKTYVKEKLWPFLAGAGSALVMVLAFFIPSIQDQYDRYQSRQVISQYERLGNSFYDEERYDMAEQAFAKALELSENKRLDIEIRRLLARINRINMQPEWNAAPPEDLEEIDFQYVLHLQNNPEDRKERIATLNSYGIFLVRSKKAKQAKDMFLQALKLDPDDVQSYVNLGNLYDQQGKKDEARINYLKAISLDKENTQAHYNLGLLYNEQGRGEEARKEFRAVLSVDSTDQDAWREYRAIPDTQTAP